MLQNPQFTQEEIKEMTTLMIRCYGIKKKYDDITYRINTLNKELNAILKQNEIVGDVQKELKERLIKKYGEFDFENVLSLISKGIG